MSSAVVAEVVRNGVVESVHQVHVVALDATGSAAVVRGDVDAQVFPRSTVKPLQAIALLRNGWQPGDDEQIALACASHSGEPAHVDAVRRILAAAGLDEGALDNTPDLPLDVAAARALVRDGGGPDPLHQNCSGKHAAMLATCVVNGWPTQGYREPGHPVQQAVRAVIEELTGDVALHTGVDGCGAPVLSCSVRGLARAFARIATVGDDVPTTRVATAMRGHPWFVGGSGRDVTALMQTVDGLVAKDGAEGVYAAALPDGRADGAGRARVPVMVTLLRSLGVDAPGLDALAAVAVLGHGAPVGEVRAVL